MTRNVCLTGVVFTLGIFAQPTILLIGNNYGWVAPGSPSYGIAQGSIFAIKGTNLGPTQYPTLLATPALGDEGVDVTVTVGATTVRVPTYYVWDKQVAGVLPSNTPVGDGTLGITYNSRGASVPIKVVPNAFGTLTMDSSGQGMAKVCDYNLDSTCATFPSFAKPARPGDVITIWGSGLGATEGDAISIELTQTVPLKVWIGGKAAPISYAARSQFVGLDLINTTIPQGVEGCHVSVAVQIANFISNFTSIPVSTTGAACSDPVTGLKGDALPEGSSKQSFNFGYIGLSHSITQTSLPSMPDEERTDETATAMFNSYAPAQYSMLPQIMLQVSYGSCSLWTYAFDENGDLIGTDSPAALDAGAISVASKGVSINMEKDASSGMYYLDLNSSSFFSGNVAVDGAGALGANTVGKFHAAIDASSGFSWSNRSAVSIVNRSQGQLITWENAAPRTKVTISGMSISIEPMAMAMFVCVAPADANRFEIPSWVLLGVPPSAVIPDLPIATGYLTVANTSPAVPFKAVGIEQGILDFSITSNNNVIYQ